jgi:hypothetical protein
MNIVKFNLFVFLEWQYTSIILQQNKTFVSNSPEQCGCLCRIQCALFGILRNATGIAFLDELEYGLRALVDDVTSDLICLSVEREQIAPELSRSGHFEIKSS